MTAEHTNRRQLRRDLSSKLVLYIHGLMRACREKYIEISKYLKIAGRARCLFDNFSKDKKNLQFFTIRDENKTDLKTKRIKGIFTTIPP